MSALLMGRLFLPFLGWGSPSGTAIVRIMEKTSSSDSLSARYLAYRYFHGLPDGGPNYARAFEYNRRLAGEADAAPEHQFLVGYMYLKGLGVEAHKGNALAWFHKTADNPRAAGSLADLARTYSEGLEGLPRGGADDRMVRRSKRLSYLLRHDREYTFPPDGWRNVGSLIPHGLSPEEIREIVNPTRRRRDSVPKATCNTSFRVPGGSEIQVTAPLFHIVNLSPGQNPP